MMERFGGGGIFSGWSTKKKHAWCIVAEFFRLFLEEILTYLNAGLLLLFDVVAMHMKSQ